MEQHKDVEQCYRLAVGTIRKLAEFAGDVQVSVFTVQNAIHAALEQYEEGNLDEARDWVWNAADDVYELTGDTTITDELEAFLWKGDDAKFDQRLDEESRERFSRRAAESPAESPVQALTPSTQMELVIEASNVLRINAGDTRAWKDLLDCLSIVESECRERAAKEPE